MPEKKETKKKPPEKKVDKKKEERLKELMAKQFLTLEEMAELAGRKPEEIQAYVDAEAIPSSCYCYPSRKVLPNSDGHQRMFLPKPTLAAIEAAKA